MTEPRTVTAMFDDIAPRYDLLNRLLSLHLDTAWRRKTSRKVAASHPTAVLDVATGTADLALQLAKDLPDARITGIDLSEKMLETGRTKIIRQGLEQRIQLVSGDASRLPFGNKQFDAVTCAFGIRNFSDTAAGLKEMTRVLRPGGSLTILEFAPVPDNLLHLPYRIYTRRLLPRIGRALSRNAEAYRYLPRSIEAFMTPAQLKTLLEDLGLKGLSVTPYCGGIVVLYQGTL